MPVMSVDADVFAKIGQSLFIFKVGGRKIPGNVDNYLKKVIF